MSSRQEVISRRLPMAALLATVVGAAPALACPAWDQAQDAFLADDPVAARAALIQSTSDSSCKALDLVQIERWAALTLRAQAFSASTQDNKREALLEEAYKIAPVWSISASLGDFARDRGDFYKAGLRYLRAVIDMQELRDPASELADGVPPIEIYTSISRKAEEMRLVAPRFVKIPGRAACVISELDDMQVKTVAPIWFETDKTTFTREGEEAADELYRCLANLKGDEIRAIRVEGHADQRGDAEYNKELSRKRAKAVVAYLRYRGLPLPMDAVGLGEDRPYRPDNPALYTQDQRWQMDRRVEVDVQYRNP